MVGDNETVGQVCEEMHKYADRVRNAIDGCAPDVADNTACGISEFAARIEAVYNREITEKDAEIAELCECLQLAIEMKCANCGLCTTRGIEPCYPEGQIVHHEDCFMIMKWRKMLEGGAK